MALLFRVTAGLSQFFVRAAGPKQGEPPSSATDSIRSDSRVEGGFTRSGIPA